MTRAGRSIRRACARGVLVPGLLLAVLVAAGSPLSAQRDGRAERPEVDPYTHGDPALLEAAGERRLGPFLFGDGRTTETIAAEAGGIPFLWVETAHFQLGSSLEPMKMPRDPRARKRLEADLAELRTHLPEVPRRVSELDPWLVLHLYAARLERLYAAFVERLGLQDLAAHEPFLGTGGPLCVLLTEKESTFARYAQQAMGRSGVSSSRYYFQNPKQQLFFGFAYEVLEGEYHEDPGLDFAVVHGVTQSLAAAVGGYHGEPPTWFTAGLAHWFARDLVDDRILLYMAPSGEVLGPDIARKDLRVRIRARVSHDAYPRFEEMAGWTDALALSFADNMTAWSKVDFLLRDEDGARAHELLLGYSKPVPWDTPDRPKALAEAYAAALAEVAGGDPADLDAAWAAWVLKTYPRR